MMSSWIQRRPRGSDLDLTRVRGPHVWRSGTTSPGLPAIITAGGPGVPPVWNPLWTERGLSFQFCDKTLAVYAAEELRGADMPTVAVEGGLQIVRGNQAKGTPQSGHATVTIPACMTLPEGHVALVATSIDPFGWAATRRRNEHADWERACPNPDGDPDATVGKVRYAQTRPIELHPWSGADMDRWPDLCRDRPAAGGTFPYSGPVYGSVSGTLPEHGECSPPGPESVGDHIAGAIANDGCRKPTQIGGTRQPRWHFYDTLCRQAASGDTAAIDGGASTHTTVVSEGDGSVFLGPPSSGPGRAPDRQYKGTPLPNPILPSPIPACVTSSYCPSPYVDGGAVGERTLIEKRRALWKQSSPGLDAVGTWEWGTGNRYRRDYEEPPSGSAPTGVPGVAKGDMWIREDFNGCYDAQIESWPNCCPPGQTGSGWKVYWDYHSHDGRGRVFKGQNCGCVDTVTEISDNPNTPENEGGYDTDGDGVADSVAAPTDVGFVDSIGGISITGTHTSGQVSSISVTSTNNGGGGGGGGGGGCFLTTAVVERRGEADDGPTLTALREFRDRYMMSSPERIAMVAEYYRRAPEIVAAIPQDHPEWNWIEAQIDSTVAAIQRGDDKVAFDAYVGAMRRLSERWLDRK